MAIEAGATGVRRTIVRWARRLMLWVVAPLLAVAILLAGFNLLFPRMAKQWAAAGATQLMIRTLALRAGTGWAGEGLTVQENIRVPMGDGVHLATDLYLPETQGPHPAIVVRTPYTKGEGKVIGEFFTRYGYAVAVQDTRGKHASEGEFYPFRAEQKDGREFTKWVKRQPWCNGKIGGFGLSYLGFTQWSAAVDNPLLTAISPAVISSDLYGAIYKGGAFGKLTYLEWSLSSYGRTGDWQGAKNIKRGYAHFPQIEADDVSLRDLDFYNDWVSHPRPDAYWQEVNGERGMERVEAPAFLVAGWYDFMLDGQMRDFREMREQGRGAARSGTKILIGPWSHGFFNVNLKNYGIEQRRLEAIPFEFIKETKDWLDYSLKGADNGWDQRPAVRAYVLGENVWRDEAEWPPRGAGERAYYLHSGGKAQTLNGDGMLRTEAPPGQQAEDTFTYDPRNPVPTKGGGHGNNWTVGPVDQREVEKREDVLVYTSEGLRAPVLAMGQVKARIYAASSARDTDFTAKLVDVFPDGRALIVCEGILRARYREGVGQETLMEPGVVYAMEIELGPTAVRFQAGHRIRLEVSSSNAPRYDVNPNTGREIATERNPVAARQRVLHDAKNPSALILPVMAK